MRHALAGSLAILAATSLAAAQPAAAAVVYWTSWNSATLGLTMGTASGIIAAPGGAIGVSYKGEVASQTVVNGTANSGYPTWQPASTWADGTTVADAPSFRDIIAQNGGSGTGVNTITFSTPVTNPVMAIWSLGAGGSSANYRFSDSEPFTIISGGPSTEYGGTGLTANGDVVTGLEGNGTLQFTGTYSQITFTNTAFENWYGFTVGVDAIAPSAVPEPASLAMFGVGLAGLAGFAVRRRRRG